MRLYMAVTADKYELPLIVSDKVKDIAKYAGTGERNIYQGIYHNFPARKTHKLDEWREFCKWCESLPYFKEIYLYENN